MNRMEIVRACTQVPGGSTTFADPDPWYRTIAFLMLKQATEINKGKKKE